MLKKFMAAASVTALLAGAAQAQLKLEATAGGSVTEGYEIAEEVDFAALNAVAAGDGTVELDIVTQGTIPPGQNLFLTIQATNAVWSAGLNGAEFNGGTTGAVVDSGGAAGNSFVRYLITTDAGAGAPPSGNGADHISVILPFNMSGCGDVTFSVTEFETEVGGTVVEGGTAVLTNATGPAFAPTPLITCEDAFQASVYDDSLAPTAPTTPTFLALANSFTDFVVAGPDTLLQARLAEFDLVVDPTINIDLLGTAASPGDILGFDAVVNFGDATNIDDADVTPSLGAFFSVATTAPVGNSITLAGGAPAGLTAENGDLLINIPGGAGNNIPAQTVTITGATLDLDTTDNLLATDAFLLSTAEDLKLEGQIFGPFDWTSDGTKLVNSIFRVTGLDPTEDVPAQIIVENARNGSAFNGVFPFTILGSSVQGSEVRFNSAAIEAVAGQFGTADISMVFSTNNDLDVDRLLAGPSTAVVVPFGDGANQDGVGGAASTTSPGTGVNDDTGNY